MTTVAIHGFAPGKRGGFRTRTLAVAVYLLWVALLCAVVVRFGVVLPADAEAPMISESQ